jgi:DUF1680 family protein
MTTITKLWALVLPAALWAQAPAKLPFAYRALPLGQVKPAGWLKNQLRIQANGLGGRLDEFWPDVGPNSGWLGGSGESWERGPYFLDGLVPLGYLLDDPTLIAKAKRFVDWTLDNQRPDGGIGPAKNQDWWPNMVMLKALTQYQEATGDRRVTQALDRYFRYHLANADRRPLQKWAVSRWMDEAVSALWLYRRTGDPKLLELVRKLHEQGYDWRKHFADFAFKGKLAKPQTNLTTHVVNNAMALKHSAVWWQVTQDPADRDAVYRQLREMDRWHLQPGGVHGGDEHYAGRDPSQGTELCAVVEAMFSLEVMTAILGDPAFGDRLEKIAYNALPATFSADMWAHQYDQQANQALCSLQPRAWTTNGPQSNLFGLEPNFGCCTANFHQGWPKLAAHLWMGTRDGGLALVAYGPSVVATSVRGGAKVTVEERTDYPFRESVTLRVKPERKTRFPLEVRIPAWAAEAKLSVNGKAQAGVTPGAYFRIEREWAPDDTVVIRLPMKLRETRQIRDSIAIERGPLVYSLRIGEDWRKIKERFPAEAADWEVHPTTPWNYALAPGTAKATEKPLGARPFSPQGAPVEVRVKARKLPQWKLENGSAAPVPQSPVSSSAPLETVTLIPYGSAKLRITAFPALAK